MGRNSRNKRHNYYRYTFKLATNKTRQLALKEAILKGEIYNAL